MGNVSFSVVMKKGWFYKGAQMRNNFYVQTLRVLIIKTKAKQRNRKNSKEEQRKTKQRNTENSKEEKRETKCVQLFR